MQFTNDETYDYDLPAIVRKTRTLEEELRAAMVVVVAAQKMCMRWIKLCPPDCRCHMCQLEEALADYYARGN